MTASSWARSFLASAGRFDTSILIIALTSLQHSLDTWGAAFESINSSPLRTFEITVLVLFASKGRLPLSIWYIEAPRE